MLKQLILAALAAASTARGAASIRNLTFDTPLDSTFGGQTVVSHFEIMAAPGAGTYYALGVAPGASAAPGPSDDWVIDEKGTYASSKAAPSNSCPQTGYPGPTEGGSSVWMAVTASFRMPSYPSCTPKKLFVVAYEGPLMDTCAYQGILSQAFTANNSGCPTATPTRTPTVPAGPTSTRTPTPPAGTPTSTPTQTSIVATFTYSPTNAATPQAAGPSAEPVRIARALMVPNPNPSLIFFDLRGNSDQILISFYSEGYSKAYEESVPGQPAGWRKAPVPAILGSGTYFVKVRAMVGGAERASSVTVARIQR